MIRFLAILGMTLALMGYGLYSLAVQEKDYVMSRYGLTLGQDEALHRQISKHLMLDIYQNIPNVTVAKGLTQLAGYAKEAMDWLDGKPISQRDLHADRQGIEEALRLIESQEPPPT